MSRLQLAKRYRTKLEYRVREIPVSKIKVWKEAQARTLDKEGIKELAKSIKNEGLQKCPFGGIKAPYPASQKCPSQK